MYVPTGRLCLASSSLLLGSESRSSGALDSSWAYIHIYVYTYVYIHICILYIYIYTYML